MIGQPVVASDKAGVAGPPVVVVAQPATVVAQPVQLLGTRHHRLRIFVYFRTLAQPKLSKLLMGGRSGGLGGCAGLGLEVLCNLGRLQ